MANGFVSPCGFWVATADEHQHQYQHQQWQQACSFTALNRPAWSVLYKIRSLIALATNFLTPGDRFFRLTRSRHNSPTANNNLIYQHCLFAGINRKYTTPPNATTNGPSMFFLLAIPVCLLFWASKNQQMLTRLEYPRPLQHLTSTLLCEENGVKSSVDVQQQSATSYQIPAELIVVMNHRRPATLGHPVPFNTNIQLNIDTNNDHVKGNIKSTSKHTTATLVIHPTTPDPTLTAIRPHRTTHRTHPKQDIHLHHMQISPSSPPSAFLTPASMSQIRPRVKPANLAA
jgi:hypothetical protein